MHDDDVRELPRYKEVYYIQEDGTVSVSSQYICDCFITPEDVHHFMDKETMLHVRNTYGPLIGVLQERAKLPPTFTPRRNMPFILGVIESSTKED